MSNWKQVQIIATAKSPIHLGTTNLAIVEQSQRWISWKPFWAALTAVITKDIMAGYNPQKYKDVGDLLRKHMRFTNFFVIDSDCSPLIPAYTREGFGYLRQGANPFISDYIFDQQYIGSYVSTAIDNETMTSEDNSLHEIEYIKQNTSFLGYIFYNPNLFEHEHIDLNEELLLKLLEDKVGIQGIGGSRSRGFGKMDLKVELQDSIGDVFNNEPITFNKEKFGVWTVETDNTSIYFRCDTSSAYCSTIIPIKLEKSPTCVDFRGDIQPLVGRNWDAKKGAGQKLDKAQVVISVGSTFKLEKEMKFELTSDGCLTPCEEGTE